LQEQIVSGWPRQSQFGADRHSTGIGTQLDAPASVSQSGWGGGPGGGFGGPPPLILQKCVDPSQRQLPQVKSPGMSGEPPAPAPETAPKPPIPIMSPPAPLEAAAPPAPVALLAATLLAVTPPDEFAGSITVPEQAAAPAKHPATTRIKRARIIQSYSLIPALSTTSGLPQER
jgi:hypothetical protein